MIPARPGLSALYDNDRTMPIHAWDDEGVAMVLDEERGRLAPARTMGKLICVIPDTYPDIVGVSPADGWRIKYSNGDGSTWDEPLVGWAILADGSVKALTADSSGYAEEVSCKSCAVYHPSTVQGQ